jgi:aminoglycoside phosphotransferase (APT) family kinase protein
VTEIDPPGLDLSALRQHLERHRPELAVGPLRATLIAGGRSNLTYVVNDGHTEYVLRRPPLGHVLATAHDMSREFRVISALADTAVPVPRALLNCVEDTVIGAPFYLMSRVPGVVLRTRAQTDPLGEQTRHEIAYAMMDTLAALHAVDADAIGLGGFGKPEGFLGRQVRRWAGQLDLSRSRDLPGADELRDALASSVPESDMTSPPRRIVHGDYRLDNMLVDPDGQPGHIVQGVLDWEMATLGDPMTDLGLLVTYWSSLTGADNPVASGLGPEAGFPTAEQLIARYAATAGPDARIDDLHWYQALSCYKLAVILEGIYFRFMHGQTVGEGFDRIGDMVVPLMAQGRAVLGGRPADQVGR